MKYQWIIKFANLHANMIQYEIKYLLPSIQCLELKNNLFVLTAEESQIMKFVRFSSLGRDILRSYVEFPSKLLYLDAISDIDFSPLLSDPICAYLQNSTTISIRFKQLGEKDRSLKSPDIEKKIFAALKPVLPNHGIDLRNPDYKIYCFKSGENAYLGWVYKSIGFKAVQERAPMHSPFFGGGALKPHLSRALVNMHQELLPYILDPFSGHGGILREIAEMGSSAIGLEINRKLSLECRENNYFHGFEDLVLLITCDSLCAPFRRGAFVQAISDPPYGLQTTTLRRGRDALLENWLMKQEIGLVFVFSSPSDMLNKLPIEWRLIDDTTDYVHRRLTRRIRKVVKWLN